jgi:DNA-binding NtrC family response regulator
MPTGTLLIIDDEARLRQLLAQVLELEGYTVLQAPDARRGLELLQQHAADILLVLSDVKLPDANGVDLLPHYKAITMGTRFRRTQPISRTCQRTGLRLSESYRKNGIPH